MVRVAMPYILGIVVADAGWLPAASQRKEPKPENLKLNTP